MKKPVDVNNYDECVWILPTLGEIHIFCVECDQWHSVIMSATAQIELTHRKVRQILVHRYSQFDFTCSKCGADVGYLIKNRLNEVVGILTRDYGGWVERPDLNELDPGIRDVVSWLWQGEFQTFTSCQGGEDHAFNMPTVRLARDTDLTNLARHLTEGGYSGFYLKQVDAYQSSEIPWQPALQSFVEVEFWLWPLDQQA